MMLLRFSTVIILFGLTCICMHFSQSARIVPISKELSQFPKQIGKWEVVSSRELSESTVKMLGVDDYVDYQYASEDGTIINLYISYFSSVGVTGGYHSPRNCLPGGGWQIASLSTMQLKKSDSFKSVGVSSMVVQQGVNKQIILYWYQNRGRIIASEYWEKFFLVIDAIFKRRRDGSFIRIMAPIHNGNFVETEAQLGDFAEKTLNLLEGFIPGKDAC